MPGRKLAFSCVISCVSWFELLLPGWLFRSSMLNVECSPRLRSSNPSHPWLPCAFWRLPLGQFVQSVSGGLFRVEG